MKFTGLYFGSFNPLHNGHLLVAQAMMNTGLFNKIRFVVSPQNPFKNTDDLWPQETRLKLVQMAINDNPDFEWSDAEFHLPLPSFSIDTVKHFRSIEPEKNFAIIMGSDNLLNLHKWKDIETLSNFCDFFVYNRRGSESVAASISIRLHTIEAPFLDISATFIRELIQMGKSIKYLVPENIISLIQDA